MSRAISGRVAALESRHQFRVFQQAITNSFQETADEIGLPACPRTAILAALQGWHTRYPLPPVGWEWDYDEAFAVADAHTLAVRRILEQHITERAILRAVCHGMRARLMTLVGANDDDTLENPYTGA
jgi:hypothetical protein